ARPDRWNERRLQGGPSLLLLKRICRRRPRPYRQTMTAKTECRRRRHSKRASVDVPGRMLSVAREFGRMRSAPDAGRALAGKHYSEAPGRLHFLGADRRLKFRGLD